MLSGGWPWGKGFVSVMKYGLRVKECLAIHSIIPLGIWCLKRNNSDPHHSYIVLTYPSRKTNTFYFESNKLSSTYDLRLDENETSLHVTRLYDGSTVQVMASRIRHITSDNGIKDMPIKGRIMKGGSISGGKQLMILLVGGFIEYYELKKTG